MEIFTSQTDTVWILLFNTTPKEITFDILEEKDKEKINLIVATE
jgi:hypothetical protein